ncbi:MAG: hypothetical protein WAV09_01130 [Minisyncoccia bacterium]
MSPLPPKKIENLGANGLIRESAVDSNLIPDGAVTESRNFLFDRIGAATVRPGITSIGSTILASRPCVGLHNAQAGTAVAVFSNGGSSTIYSLSGTTWSMSLDGGTASVKIRFVDFGSYTIALNFMYDTYTSMRFWNAGSSRHWHNTGNPINPQNMWGYANQLGEVYKSKIYLGGDTSKEGNPSRLYFSSVISSTGRITWSPTTDYVDINPGDGEGMTGLKRFSLELLVFKPNYIYRFRTTGVDPDPLIKIGTRSQESIVEGKRGLYFHHDTGFYRYTGGYPQEISRPVSDLVDAIPFSQFDDIVGWNDQDHIYWSIGNVTVQEAKESVTFKNCVLRYTESSDVWTVYSYGQEIRRGMTYTTSSAISRIVGTDMGNVATHNSGTTDMGAPIPYRLRTKWYDWGTVATTKVIEEVVAVCEKSLGSTLMYKVNEELEWKTLGNLTKLATHFDKKQIRFNRIKFQITGMSRDEAPVFLGIDVIKGKDEGLTAYE